jgi:hypothetical protein
MLDYQRRGTLPEKHHIVFDRADGKGVYYEECITRRGFDGAYAILYHAFPTTDDGAVRKTTRGWSAPIAANFEDETLRRRLFDANKVPRGGQMLDCRIPVMFNCDLVMLLANPTQSDDAYFTNGDGDELVYVYAGSGKLESSFGWLPFKEGDYVWIPKGVIHRWHLEGEGHSFLVMEARKELRIPTQFRNATGQLKMDAPYCHPRFRAPRRHGVGALAGRRRTAHHRVQDARQVQRANHAPPPARPLDAGAAALGVVYGDSGRARRARRRVGTSPLYAVKECFNTAEHALAPSRENVLRNSLADHLGPGRWSSPTSTSRSSCARTTAAKAGRSRSSRC